MTRPALFVVKATIAPELEEAFNQWYDTVRSREAARVPGCLGMRRYAPIPLETAHAGAEPGDALMAVRRAAPDLSLAREDVPILVDCSEVAGAANHPRRHGRVDHVAVRSVHEKTDMSSQGRSTLLRGIDIDGLHVLTPGKGTVGEPVLDCGMSPPTRHP